MWQPSQNLCSSSLPRMFFREVVISLYLHDSSRSGLRDRNLIFFFPEHRLHDRFWRIRSLITGAGSIRGTVAVYSDGWPATRAQWVGRRSVRQVAHDAGSKEGASGDRRGRGAYRSRADRDVAGRRQSVAPERRECVSGGLIPASRPASRARPWHPRPGLRRRRAVACPPLLQSPSTSWRVRPCLQGPCLPSGHG